jgi:hypothetical protein
MVPNESSADPTDADPSAAKPRTPEGQADRSGPDVVAAVERAAAGTQAGGVQTPPERAQPHEAPVEQVRDDEAMTGGQIVTGPGERADVPSSPDPAASGSGGAQSMEGARISDRVAAGEDLAAGQR